MNFYDVSNNPLSSQSLSVEPGETVEFPFKAECVAGKSLRAAAIENLTIEGRFAGDALFTDLTTDGLDVGDYDGEIKEFDIRITANGDAGYQVENVIIEIKT